jgi:antitoxin component YwqK of YwqJK toxin-antitoxin module
MSVENIIHLDGSRESYEVNPVGRKHGEYKSFYNNGKLNIHCFYNFGELEGKYVKYCKNGKLNITAKYVNGKKIGWYKQFYSFGEPYRVFFHPGKVPDKFKYKLVTDKKYKKVIQRYIKTYDKDNRSYYKEYFDNGKLKKSIIKENGRLVDYVSYDIDGNKVKTKQFYKGVICQYNKYYPDGTLVESRHYDDDGYLEEIWTFKYNVLGEEDIHVEYF